MDEEKVEADSAKASLSSMTFIQSRVVEDEKEELNHLPKFKFKNTFSRLFQSIKIRFFSKYSKWWEEDSEPLYYESTDEDKDRIIVKQIFVEASKISLDHYGKLTFPWHGYSYEDFCKLNRKLQRVLPKFEKCQTEKAATRLMRLHYTVYNAFFEKPIQVFDNSDDTYILASDGRHRAFTAKENKGRLPVWVVEYRNARELSLEDYKRDFANGSWRFGE